MALGTYLESDTNKVKLLEINDGKQNIRPVSEIDHLYPPTKIKF